MDVTFSVEVCVMFPEKDSSLAKKLCVDDSSLVKPFVGDANISCVRWFNNPCDLLIEFKYASSYFVLQSVEEVG